MQKVYPEPQQKGLWHFHRPTQFGNRLGVSLLVAVSPWNRHEWQFLQFYYDKQEVVTRPRAYKTQARKRTIHRTISDCLTMEKSLLLALCLVGGACASGEHWNYNYSSPKGPNNWANFYHNCGGSSQSPINIITNQSAYDSALGQLRFTNYDSIPSNATVSFVNNGHTFMVSTLAEYFVSDGGLLGRYKTVQFHFHWGSTSSKGSEHLINGIAYPGVIHIVSYNTKYSTVGEAKTRPDGLAVVAVFLKIGDANPGLDVFWNDSIISQVINEGNTSAIPQTVALDTILPDVRDFYRYNGSLTTPTCDQTVTWSVMRNPISVSEAQLNQLRKLKQDDGSQLQNNFRPSMPLNGRVINTNFKTGEVTTPTSPTAHAVTMAASGMIVVMAALLGMIPFV